MQTRKEVGSMVMVRYSYKEMHRDLLPPPRPDPYFSTPPNNASIL